MVTNCRLKGVFPAGTWPCKKSSVHGSSISCVLFTPSPSLTCFVGPECFWGWPCLCEVSTVLQPHSLLRLLLLQQQSSTGCVALTDTRYILHHVHWEKCSTNQGFNSVEERGVCSTLISFSDILACNHSLAFRSENSWMKDMFLLLALFAANVQKLRFSCTYFSWQKR